MTENKRRDAAPKRRCRKCGTEGFPTDACPRDGSTDVSWTATVWVPTSDGDRKRKRVTAATKKACRDAMDAMRVDAKRKGGHRDPSRITVGEYLAAWLDDLVDVAASTRDNYRTHVESYIVSRVGKVRLVDLRQRHVRAMVADLRVAPRLRGNGNGLAESTIAAITTTLSIALNAATTGDEPLLDRNPARGAYARPRGHGAPQGQPPAHWSPEQARAFLDHVRDDRLYALWFLALSTGMRRAELAGLRWMDVRLGGDPEILLTLQRARDVEGVGLRELKTKRSRAIPLDDDTVSVLIAHGAQQVEERNAWGEAWEGPADPSEQWVFAQENGDCLRLGWMTAAFERHVKRAGLPYIRLHGLRHTHATHMLAAGVEARLVADQLGHSKTAMTDKYLHPSSEMRRAAQERFAAFRRGEVTT